MVWVQTDRKGFMERGVACEPAKFPGLVNKAACAKGSVSMQQNWGGTEGGGDGVRGAPLLLVELELQPQPARLLSPGHPHPSSLQGGGR